jgi:hypothetical protein
MRRQLMILAWQSGIDMADGGTIERKTRISQPSDESARCKDSRAWGQRNDFSPPTEQCTTTSRFSFTSRHPRLTVPSEPRPCGRGTKPSLSRDGGRSIKSVRMLFSNVTMPARGAEDGVNGHRDQRRKQPCLRRQSRNRRVGESLRQDDGRRPTERLVRSAMEASENAAQERKISPGRLRVKTSRYPSCIPD